MKEVYQMGNAATRAKNKYNEENYERVALNIKKGTKSTLTSVAKEQGQSLNGFIKAAVKEKYEVLTGEKIEL